MMDSYDLIVVGAGPGGYVAAIRAAQLGQKVAIVEKTNAGGTCLNVGCIPSKTLLEHGTKAHDIRKANDWGIETQGMKVNFSKLVQRKQHIVSTLTGGVKQLLKKNKVTFIKGEATVTKDLEVKVSNQSYQAKDIILATGSKPFIPPIEGLNDIKYETTDTFFDIETLPKQLAIIGGGVIATELASSMADLGVEVTMIEVNEDILLTEIEEVRELLKDHLKNQSIRILTGAKISKVTTSKVILDNHEDVSFDTLLVATGRQPNIKVVEDLDIDMDGKFVQVDEHYQTTINHVYAIGDLVKGYQLAHSASSHGLHVVETLAGLKPTPVSPNNITRCIYTRLEAASVGLSESQAKEAGYDVSVTQSSFQGNAKALVKGEVQGFIKIVTDKAYGEVLGAFIVGPHATDLISEVLGVKASEGTMNELSNIIQPHPSLSEAIGESADAYFGKAIHM
ncbi:MULTISPECIES: dihydrolipoyl dehydrogenase [Staphylococcus]|uniref:dihydrolipoyl dehydrogenase n=1 Tax=Staphylococcus TaxID=1279 RepID=UPI0006ABC691|nr:MULTISPECIES: dihydrolipoyl dehydrogenase [Staphylococcus]KOR12674.1 acetoin dehydrogenase [Staphylococcus carnosus]PTF19719.1 dihydrolipoyl dehydrogenase [Staphylococcus cohnii]PTF22945.1 dihydrolipoyl dehydrogenase [Staphylococcus cohnii]PTF29349.1 dihydrolipoyl dehydrogenase [Staphylococcus cohnii]PTF33182.1 dihydrolipoyl dehydrogenase [Staphylococcus cohnii]